MKFAKFMATPVGRIARIVAGLALVILAVTAPSWWTIALAALGVVFIIAGVLNVCFIAPILRVPFRAKNLGS